MKTENSLFQQQQSWLPLLQCLDSSHCLASPVGVFVSQGVGLAKNLLSKPVFLSEFVQISLFFILGKCRAPSGFQIKQKLSIGELSY